MQHYFIEKEHKKSDYFIFEDEILDKNLSLNQLIVFLARIRLMTERECY